MKLSWLIALAPRPLDVIESGYSIRAPGTFYRDQIKSTISCAFPPSQPRRPSSFESPPPFAQLERLRTLTLSLYNPLAFAIHFKTNLFPSTRCSANPLSSLASLLLSLPTSTCVSRLQRWKLPFLIPSSLKCRSPPLSLRLHGPLVRLRQ